MKKLYLLSILVLTTLGLFYSCSVEEEDTAPPASVVTTPEPEPPAPTQYTLTVTAGEGGTVSSEGGTYDEGTEVTITATSNSGYVFVGWEEDESIVSNDITIELNGNKTLTPIFLQIPQINTNTSWNKQGFTSAIWSSRYNEVCGHESSSFNIALNEFKKTLIKYINTGANSIIIDWHMVLEYSYLDENFPDKPTGSIISNEPDHSVDFIGAKIEIAKEFGLEVWIKPIILTNGRGDWGEIEPYDSDLFFENYEARINDVFNSTNSSNIDVLLITNELVNLTNDINYKDNWVNIINSFKSRYPVEIGMNVRGLSPYKSEWKNISHLTNNLDFLGISAYLAQWIGESTENKSVEGISNILDYFY